MSTIDNKLNSRKNNFDAIRLFAAALVLFSHSYPLSGNTQEPFVVNWGIETGGGIGVSIFFVLSGFLVCRSLMYSKNILRYVGARSLRIFPGYIVVIALTVYLLGPLVSSYPASQYFSSNLVDLYLKNVFLFPIYYFLPGVFESNTTAAVNGSLWTLPVEVAMYLTLLAIFMVLKLNKFTLAITFVLFLSGFLVATNVYQLSGENQGAMLLDGVTTYYFLKLGMFFFLGAFIYAYREYIVVRNGYALLALIAVMAAPYIRILHLSYIVFVLATSYLVLYVAFLDIDLSKYTKKIGDVSYGMYIYAFPVQQAVVHFHGGKVGVMRLALISLAITFIFSYLSWHLVEKRMLMLKKFLP